MPHPRPFSGWAALVLPTFGVSTPLVYQSLAASRRARANEACGNQSNEHAGKPWDTPWANAAELSARLFNDLTAPACALESRLDVLLKALNDCDSVRVHMSGSGSTLFALFDDETAAAEWVGRRGLERVPAEFRIVRCLERI